MKSVRKAGIGEVLYFTPEELTILVVMAGEHGVRYIDPMNPEFDENGNIITKYANYTTLGEWTVSFGSINNISAYLMGKSN